MSYARRFYDFRAVDMSRQAYSITRQKISLRGNEWLLRTIMIDKGGDVCARIASSTLFVSAGFVWPHNTLH